MFLIVFGVVIYYYGIFGLIALIWLLVIVLPALKLNFGVKWYLWVVLRVLLVFSDWWLFSGVCLFSMLVLSWLVSYWFCLRFALGLIVCICLVVVVCLFRLIDV